MQKIRNAKIQFRVGCCLWGFAMLIESKVYVRKRATIASNIFRCHQTEWHIFFYLSVSNQCDFCYSKTFQRKHKYLTIKYILRTIFPIMINIYIKEFLLNSLQSLFPILALFCVALYVIAHFVKLSIYFCWQLNIWIWIH